MSEAIGAGIDWGSSNLRAWVFDARGNVLRESKRSISLKEARAQGFATVFSDLKAQLGLSEGLPVVACGMIGAKDGWLEAPYVPCLATPKTIQNNSLEMRENNLWILPGLSNATPVSDVMRGEETQICGAIAKNHSGLFCLPGTHSKWAEVEAGQITSFRTFVTGELFALSQAHAVWGQFAKKDTFDMEAFRLGLLATEDSPLLNTLFQTRSRVLSGELSGAQSTWFLSGRLIGTEVKTANPDKHPVTLLADHQLAELYTLVFTDLGIPFNTISAEACTTSALFRALRQITRDPHDQ